MVAQGGKETWQSEARNPHSTIWWVWVFATILRLSVAGLALMRLSEDGSEMKIRSVRRQGRLAAAMFAVALTTIGLGANRDHHVVLITLDGFPAYLWRDPMIPLPHLRALAAGGAVADALSVSNPSITWPNHTTLVTGVTPRKHGVLYNGWVTRQGPGQPTRIEPWTDKEKLVRVPTVYDAAYHAGLTTAEMDWVAVTRPGTINWSFAEIPDPESVVVKEMIAAGILSAEDVAPAPGSKRNIVWRDEKWLRAAQFVFERHRPNLTLLHFLNTDSTHHRYGPGSLPSISALALADRLVGEMLRTIEESGRKAQTTVIVTTDHGFKKVAHFVYPNVSLKKAGLLTQAGARVVACDAYVGMQGGIGFVYITDPAKKAELKPRLRELFSAAKGIARVLDGSEAPSLGMPTPEENEAMGDLILYPEDGHALQSTAAGELDVGPAIDYAGTHGFPAEDPELDGIFIAAGAGIRKGVSLPRVKNVDVAPTIAYLLDVPLPTADGQVLHEILEPRKP